MAHHMQEIPTDMARWQLRAIERAQDRDDELEDASAAPGA